MFRRILSSTRYLIIVPILGAFVGALALLFFATVQEALTLLRAFGAIGAPGLGYKELALDLIQILDILLLAVGFYMIAMGLYELFIDDRLEMPGWLVIHNFDDLKTNLVSIIIVILAVTFLSQAVKWDGELDIMGYGIAIGLVIAALTYFSSVKAKKAALEAKKNEASDAE
jgi:uncharacterized membrane protein YqhA